MSITQVTTWTGTPAAIELLEAASKQSAPFHESLGAKNPRLMRGITGILLHCRFLHPGF
ncbi:MAG: hypothetical protein ACJZ2F_04425 [Acidimicrobiales bacterium]